jgi:hypothetical protein
MDKKRYLIFKVFLNWRIFDSQLYSWISNVCLFVLSIEFLILYFLDRMPPQIGRFISEVIYDAKLQSFSDHPVKDSTLACRFIDVVGGQESLQDTSYMVYA